eukprot:jgi/Botrbrau1/13728/Bobra.0356s0008.1
MVNAPLYTVQKYPKSVLHEFYQVHSGTPIFNVDQVPGTPEPKFRCVLTCPAITHKGTPIAEQTFEAEARSKKAAEHDAAGRALNHFRSLNVLPAEPVPVAPMAPLAPNATGPITMDELRFFFQRLIITFTAVGAGLQGGQAELAPARATPAERITDEELARMSRGEIETAFKEVRTVARSLRAELLAKEQTAETARELLTAKVGLDTQLERPPAELPQDIMDYRAGDIGGW